MKLFARLSSLFSTDLAIDLGTANTLIYVPNRGIVLNEPSVVAIRQSGSHRTVAAVGIEAKKMLGRNPGNISVVRPLKDGVIADFQITEEMLRVFMRKVVPDSIFQRSPRVVVAVPCKSTSVEKRAIREAAINAGAREIKIMEEPMAAAIGAGLPVEQACGTMIVDIGGGTTEIAVISLSGCVYSESLRIGGDLFDDCIVSHVRRHHGCLIGESTAERIKIEIGSALPTSDVREIEVRGRHLAEGVPRSFVVNSEEIWQAFEDPLASIVNEVKLALEQTPSELSADIVERGIVLTGGGSLLRDLDALLSRETSLPVIRADDPLTCVARGAGRALAYMDNPAYEMLFVR